MTNGLATRSMALHGIKRAGVKQNTRGTVSRLPEYLDQGQVEALMVQAPHAQARLLMLAQWRAGLRISEALALAIGDLNFTGDNPTVRVRKGKGKGNKPRIVPLHLELAAALQTFLDYSPNIRGYIFSVTRLTAWRWMRDAAERCVRLNQLPAGKTVGTHTLRHSAARRQH